MNVPVFFPFIHSYLFVCFRLFNYYFVLQSILTDALHVRVYACTVCIHTVFYSWHQSLLLLFFVRAIIARFLRYKDCEQILFHCRRLKDTDYKMYQDLRYGIVERKRKEVDVFKNAKRNKIPAVFSKSQPHKLYN